MAHPAVLRGQECPRHTGHGQCTRTGVAAPHGARAMHADRSGRRVARLPRAFPQALKRGCSCAAFSARVELVPFPVMFFHWWFKFGNGLGHAHHAKTGPHRLRPVRRHTSLARHTGLTLARSPPTSASHLYWDGRCGRGEGWRFCRRSPGLRRPRQKSCACPLATGWERR